MVDLVVPVTLVNVFTHTVLVKFTFSRSFNICLYDVGMERQGPSMWKVTFDHMMPVKKTEYFNVPINHSHVKKTLMFNAH